MRILANTSPLEVLALLKLWKAVLEDCEAVNTKGDDCADTTNFSWMVDFQPSSVPKVINVIPLTRTSSCREPPFSVEKSGRFEFTVTSPASPFLSLSVAAWY